MQVLLATNRQVAELQPQRKYSRGIMPKPMIVPKPMTKTGVSRLNQPPRSHSEDAMNENASP